MASESWTPERVALLRGLWSADEAATAIAARLGGMSRSAVLGKVYRLRLDADGSAVAAAAKKRGTREANTLLARRRQGGKRKREPQIAPATGRCGTTLLELTNATCRWPHGRPGTKNFFFCGAAGADLERGLPYCAHHMQARLSGNRKRCPQGEAADLGRRASPAALDQICAAAAAVCSDRLII